MAGLAQFGQLVGEIYDAGADPAAWERALAKINDALGGVDVVLGGHVEGGRPLFIAPHTDPAMVELYAQYYHSTNPLPLALVRAPTARAVADCQMTDLAAFHDSEFYNEWCLPQGHVAGAGMKIDTTGGWSALLMISSREALGAEQLSHLELLAPHFTRALRINQLLREQQAHTLNAFAALEHADRGIFYVWEDLRCEPGNCVADDIVSRADGLVLRNGRLRCADETADVQLQRVLVSHSGGTGANVTVPRDPPALPLNIFAVPMLEGAGRDQRNGRKMMLVVTAPEVILQRRVERLREQLHLTKAEAEVLRELAEGGDREEIANRLGVSLATVRTQLTSIFDKSGVRRQTEIIRLLMSPY